MTHFRSIELTDDQIKAFQKIYRMEYGEEISFEIARKEATRVLRFLSFICK